MNTHEHYLAAAYEEALQGLAEGGIPIGAVLVDAEGRIVGRGRNRRVQDTSVIHHAEMNCLENAGHLGTATYQGATLYSTLSPCFMCAGAAVLLGIRRVVAGENKTVGMAETFMREQGISLQVLDDERCHALLQGWIRDHPEVWDDDKGDH